MGFIGFRPALQRRTIGQFGYQISVSCSAVSAGFNHQSGWIGRYFAKRLEHPLHGRLVRLFLRCLEDMKQDSLTASQILGDECLHPSVSDCFKKLELVGELHGFCWFDDTGSTSSNAPEPYTLHRHYLDSKEANP